MWKKMNDAIKEEERRESRNGNTEEGRGVFMVAEKRMLSVYLSVCCPRPECMIIYCTVQWLSWLRA